MIGFVIIAGRSIGSAGDESGDTETDTDTDTDRGKEIGDPLFVVPLSHTFDILIELEN